MGGEREKENIRLQKSFKSMVSFHENLASNFCAVGQPFNLRSKVIRLRSIKRKIEATSNLLIKPLMKTRILSVTHVKNKNPVNGF